MTLLDYPGKVACTVFLGGCDFRCPYCHNAELLSGDALPVIGDGELLNFLKQRGKLLDGVVITGGEPLLRDVAPLLKEIKALGFCVKLDTNGAHPARLRALIEAELVDYVAMDIKNSPARWAETIGFPEFDISPVLESVALLLAGKVDYEFRTTVVDELHDADSFHGIGTLIRGAARCFLQPFTDRDTVPYGGLHAPGREALERYAEILREYVTSVEIRGA